MKRFVAIVAIVGLGYLLYRVVPPETRARTLAGIGIPQFFGQTMPRYLREKLSIPQNPTAKRKQVLDELAGSVANIVDELDGAAPPNAPIASLPPAVRQRVERARELALQSESKIRELEASNEDVGIFQKIAERIFDRVIPPPEGVCAAPAS